MGTNFPQAIDTFVNPTATDYLNSPSHAGQHANANDSILALESRVRNKVKELYLLDYPSLQDLIDEMATDDVGGVILLPNGDTEISEEVDVPVGLRYLTFRGTNKGSSTLKWTGAAGGTLLKLGDGSVASEPNYIAFENMKFNGDYIASNLVDSYAGRIYMQNVRFGGVNDGIALKFENNCYYVYLNNVEFRNDGAHNSTAIETNAPANAYTFINVGVQLFEQIGIHIKGSFNSFNIIGGTIENCTHQAILVTAGGQSLKIDGLYVENCGQVGEGMIETLARVQPMAVDNIYFNPSAANYCIKVVNTILEVGSIYVSAGFSSMINLDANSRLIERGVMHGTDTKVSGDGNIIQEFNNGGYTHIQKGGYGKTRTITKNGGTLYDDLTIYYEPILIEVSIIGRFGSSSTGIAKKWNVFCYMGSDGTTIADGDVNVVDSLGDALVSNIDLAIAAVGSDYKLRLTFTNNYATTDFTLYNLDLRIVRYRIDGAIPKLS